MNYLRVLEHLMRGQIKFLALKNAEKCQKKEYGPTKISVAGSAEEGGVIIKQ